MSRSSPCPLTSDHNLRIAADKVTATIQREFPGGLAKPALRALAAAGMAKLSDLAVVTEPDLAALHGMGPKAIGLLRDALKQKGLAFRHERKKT